MADVNADREQQNGKRRAGRESLIQRKPIGGQTSVRHVVPYSWRIASCVLVLLLATQSPPRVASIDVEGGLGGAEDPWGWAYREEVCGAWHTNYTHLHRIIRSAARQLVQARQTDSAGTSGAAGGGRGHGDGVWEARNDEEGGGGGGGDGEGGGEAARMAGMVRFATYSCESLARCGGVGDVLLGVFSTFLIALLQDRALVLSHPLLHHAFLPAHVNWTLDDDVPWGAGRELDPNNPTDGAQQQQQPPPHHAGDFGDVARWTALGCLTLTSCTLLLFCSTLSIPASLRSSSSISSFPSIPRPHPYLPLPLAASLVLHAEAQPGEVTDVNLQDTVPPSPEAFFARHEAAANMRVRWNRGVATRLFREGGDWSRLLHRLGLRLPVSFGCVIRFLLRPKLEVLRAVEQQMREVERPGVSSICIHTRTPDEMTWTNRGEVLGGENDAAAELLGWARNKLLACAQKVEDFWIPGDVAVRWVFLSNSRDIKEAVLAQYGDSKVLTTGITPLHTAMVRAAAARVASWQTSVAEWVLLTRCSLFVVTESGFSKTAALFSLRPLAIYLLARHHYRSARNQWTDSCDPERPASFALLGERWSGI
ncbi:unnamed protein product [Closterium sp. NIES-64]|nr:unnamed protein product [Closterium sp. NIES-64]